ncbi:MAG: nucleotide sugar dehydrogenase [Weeksellaceae bacterium]|nr:nucleotide sugar dehydrogenase [Weeksellaceae bacterium]
MEQAEKGSFGQTVILGLGYIGLPAAALLSDAGMQVLGVDINSELVEQLSKGEVSIDEPSLAEMVAKSIASGKLKVDTTPSEADVYVIAVPTPHQADYTPDMQFVESAVQSIVPLLKEDNLIIIESTSPVGTTESLHKQIVEQRPELEGKIRLAYCPERVLPGNILHELRHNDRVIGGTDEESTQAAMDFYKRFTIGDLHATNAATAEMCKLAENAYRDVNIAYANELSMLADAAGINAQELISLTNRHPRVNILQPGIGVGGHCIAVDPWFLIAAWPEQTHLMRAARQVNKEKTRYTIREIMRGIQGWSEEKDRKPRIAVLGLSYKPNVGDLRESPAVEIAEHLRSYFPELICVEPHISLGSYKGLMPMDEAIAQADILIPLVQHECFQGKIPEDKLLKL